MRRAQPIWSGWISTFSTTLASSNTQKSKTKLAQCITEAINKQRTIQEEKGMLKREKKKRERQTETSEDEESGSVSWNKALSWSCFEPDPCVAECCVARYVGQNDKAHLQCILLPVTGFGLWGQEVMRSPSEPSTQQSSVTQRQPPLFCRQTRHLLKTCMSSDTTTVLLDFWTHSPPIPHGPIHLPLKPNQALGRGEWCECRREFGVTVSIFPEVCMFNVSLGWNVWCDTANKSQHKKLGDWAVHTTTRPNALKHNLNKPKKLGHMGTLWSYDIAFLQ